MHDLLLFPCNGNALEALDCVGDGLRPLGFVDDDPRKVGSDVAGLPVWSRAALSAFPDAKVLAVPGSPTSFARRASLIASLSVPPERFVSVVHPRAAVSPHAHIGANVLIMAGAVITATAIIEDHVVVLPNSVVHHDSLIGAYTILGAGALVAGHVHLGRNCYVGAGVRLRNGIAVAPLTLIGIGSTVLRSIDEPGGVWAGTPARCLHPSLTASATPAR